MVTIIWNNGKKEEWSIEGNTNTSVLSFFQKNHIHAVSAPCGGNGSCGKCMVTEAKLGQVLACQTPLEDGMTFYLHAEEQMNILTDSVKETDCEKKIEVKSGRPSYHIACDLGTTTVVCQLLDTTKEQVLDTIGEPNKQSVFGADVIARITACQNGKLNELHQVIVKQLVEMIEHLCSCNQIVPEELESITVAGNTVMCHLLVGLSPESIGVAPFQPIHFFGEEWKQSQVFPWPNTRLYVMPAIAGYVGGDIVSDLFSIWNQLSEEYVLLIDIGTNGEIVFGNKNSLSCCAVAAGPAFEGGEILMGMQAEAGAISHVWCDQRSMIQIETIMNKPPRGICGSGLIDALAVLIDRKLVDENGSFIPKEDCPVLYRDRFEEIEEEMVFFLSEQVYISQSDIRNLQMAKAAIGAGIDFMKKKLGIQTEQIQTLYLAGGFGWFINPASAAQIGLFPESLLPVTKAIGNASLAGAAMLEFHPERKETLAEIKSRCQYYELSVEDEFQDLYIKHLLLS